MGKQSFDEYAREWAARVNGNSQSGSETREGSAPAGYTSSNAGKTKVLDPDSSAYAASVKDKYKETQQPWYIVQEESAKNADTSAHAQKEKDGYVTGNILYHQWEQQQKNLKADSGAHAQAEKDDEAEKNPLFHQWKTAFDRQQEQKAAANEYKINKLQKELDELDRNASYSPTTAASEEYQNRRKEIVDEMVSLGGDGKGSGEKVGSNIKLVVDQGLTQADHRIAQTADWLFGGIAKEGKALVNSTLQTINPEWGFKDEDPWITRYNKKGAEVLNANEQEAQRRASENELNTTVWKYAPQVVAAIPDAVLAMITGGASKGAQATIKALEAASTIAQGSKAYKTVKPLANTVEKMITSPAWASAFAQSAGSSYENALAEGASEEQASLYAMVNGMANATIEVGGGDEALGGIQNLPTQVQGAIRRGDSKLIAQWAKSIVNEAGEEVAQGIAEKGFRGIYSDDVPLVSTEDENAVINPNRMKEEAIGGAVVSAFLGGGQTAIQAVANSTVNNNSAPNQSNVESEAPTDASQPTGDNSAPATVQNVKQGGSDALNPVANPDVANAQTVVPVETQKNAASTQETESTAVNDAPSTHTAEEMKRIEEYKAAVDDNLVNYIETVRNNPGAKIGRYSLKPVSERAANDIKAITGVDVSGNKTSIEPRIISHIFKGHGERGKTDSSMRDINDIARMQYILDNYDTIEDGGRSSAYQTIKPNGKTGQARTVVFSKAIDGTYYVVEAVPDTKAKTVFVVTAYLTNKKTGDMQTANAEATRVTSETKNAQSPVTNTSLDGARRLPNDGSIPSGISSEVSDDISSDTSIPTTGQNVNGKFEGDGESAKRTKDGQYIIDGYANGISRERGVSKNVRTDAAMEKNLRESFNQSPEMYTQLSNKETLAKAKEIYAKGYEHARSEVEQAIARGKEGYKLAPEIAPLAKMVSNELTRRGEVETAHRIMADIALEATAAGQFNQAQRIMRNSDPQTALMAMEKLVEEVNAEFQKTNPKSKWEASLTETEKQQILSTDFTEDGAWESVYETVADRIGKEMPVKFGEKVTELRRMNMLLRPRTMIKNVASNIPMIGLRKGAETLSIGIQKALVKTGVMDESQRTRGWASDEQRQLAKDYYEANKADINGQSNKWDFKSILREHKTVFKGGAIEKAFNKMTGAEVDSFAEALRQTTYSLLESGDAPFVKSAFVDSLAQYCAAKGITNAENITPEAVQFATANAMEATFKNANVIAKSLNEIKRKSPGAGAALDILIPFTTTPANILQLTIDYSPAGFVKLATNADIASKIDAFSKASVGTALLALGYAARNIGWITGGEDDDKDKAALDRATGQGTYSIGGKVSYDWAQPVGSLLAIGAEISDAVKGQESWASAFLNSVYSVGDSILNVSVFQNILSVLKGKGTSATAQIIDAIMDGGITQLVPGIAGDIAKIIDGTVRSTYTGGNAFEDASAKALAMIPGMSKVLPESVNVKGETNTRGEPIERILNTLINPTTITRGERNAVDDELYRLMDVTGSKTFLPSVSPYKVEYGNDEYTMTGKEREAFQKTQGQTYYELAYSLLVSEIYKALSDDEKAATLNAIRDYALSEAKRQFIEGKNTEYTSATDGVNDLPDGANYFAMKQAFTVAGKSGATSETYNALDTALEYWVELSQPTQDKLRSSNLNVDALRYADAMGIGSQEWYGTKSAIMESSKTLGETDVAKAIAVYNSMEDASDEEIFNAMRTQLLPEDAKPNTTIRRIEAYNTVAGDKANLGEWLNLVAELHDANENSSISKDDVYAAWGNMGLDEKETYAGITRDDFYNIVKNGSKSYAVNEKYATQFDEVYAALVPSAEKTKNTLANSVSGHNTATEDTQSGTKQYYSPIDFLLAGTPYASYK